MDIKVILDKSDYDKLTQEIDQKATLLIGFQDATEQQRAEIDRLQKQLANKPVVRIDDPNEPWGDTGRTYNAKSHNVFWGRHGLWINTGGEFRIYLGEGASLDPQ